MNDVKPPRFVFCFLQWFCPDNLYEEIEGDLIQKFNRDFVRIGQAKANRRLLWNAFRFFRPGIIFRNKFSVGLNRFDMLNHFFKIFFRSSLKNSSYSIINIGGLVLGMTAFTLISIYVWNERSYDNFHDKKEQIFRIRQDRYTHGELTRQWTAGPWGIGADLKRNFPEVIRYACVNRGGMRSTVLANGNIFFEEDRVFFASEDFFKIFSFPLTSGVDSLVLRDPFTMVVSESLARRYFGDQDPIGKTLKNNGKEEYEITGVFKDVAENTHLKFDALFSFESHLKIIGPTETQDLMTNWGWAGNYTYIELAPSVNYKAFEAKLPAFVEKEAGEILRSWGESMAFVLQPVSSIHLHSNFKDELEPNGDGQAVNFLALIAGFILVMAWINYINLSTARSMTRAKEVRVRKVLGSDRAKLIRQFLFESFAIKLIALGITAVLVGLLLPYFSNFISRKIDLLIFTSTQVWIFIAGIFLIGVVGSGLYPAFVMSRFAPLNNLRGKSETSVSGGYLRKVLVTLQFVCSVILIVGTFAVHKQIQFMLARPLGIDTEQVLIVQSPHVADSTYASRYNTFRQSLFEYPDIHKIAVSSDVPGRTVRGSNGGVRLVGEDIKSGNAYRIILVDENFTDAHGMQVLKGRTFSRDFNDHWKTALVNETAMKLLGFSDPEKVIGQKIYVWDETLEIVGVLKDYHQESLKKKVDQLIFVCDTGILDYYSIKIKTDKPLTEIVNKTELNYKAAFPGNPFHYFFLDDYYNQQYQSDVQFGNVFSLFTLLAIIIACLGLFGLSSYVVALRTKEIGIRKVLGASVEKIAIIVSREFILIVLLANLIAWPVSYFIMDYWLTGFAYRIDLGILIFLIPGVSALLLAVLTVAFQSIKAASANPVNSLRSE